MTTHLEALIKRIKELDARRSLADECAKLVKIIEVQREALKTSEKALSIVSDWHQAFPEGLEINGKWRKPSELWLEVRSAIEQAEKIAEVRNEDNKQHGVS